MFVILIVLRLKILMNIPKNLTESPFLIMLDYGSNKDGYWTGNHMIFQFEDCIYCLRVLCGDRYKFVFLFDHISGHGKKQVNGKYATKMIKFHGRRLQHPTLIK